MEESRSRALSDDELREVWIASQGLEWPFAPLVRALILTGQRRNELAGMTWAEIDDQTQQWIIPGLRTKNGKEHIVPLSPAMQALLAGVPSFGDSEDLERPVFTTTGKTSVSGFSRAKARLDGFILAARRHEAAQNGRDPAKVKQMPSWTIHDLRRSCATGMARIGTAPHIIETVLNHSSGFRAGIAGVYQRHPYLEERRHALNAWAAHITGLAAPQEPTANVVSFRGARS
jgi:integrase